uniref:Uncharacterized protein n=1 Tax=Zea mays TaxID=4577 RepID=B4FZH1_MAIZE|nr:unknown [Zea mays]
MQYATKTRIKHTADSLLNRILGTDLHGPPRQMLNQLFRSCAFDRGVLFNMCNVIKTSYIQMIDSAHQTRPPPCLISWPYWEYHGRIGSSLLQL